MKIAFFGTCSYDREAFERERAGTGHEIVYLEPRLTAATAALARGCPAVCSFVNDRVDAEAVRLLDEAGVRLIALRCAGFNHVDLQAAARHGIQVARVPAYSPYAVAEHTIALLLTLNRKIHRAHARVREGNFALEGLVGFDLHGKTIGVVGTGKIGMAAVRIFAGFGCRVLAHDLAPPAELARFAEAADLDRLYRESDVVSLHVPLTPATRHMIDAAALARMKRGVVLLNTSRGALVDTRALIAGLKSGHVGAAGLDVYEEEEGVFFNDLSGQVLQDDVLARLTTFPNVLITAHQAFLTRDALANIASTTLHNVTRFAAGQPLENAVRAP